MAHIGYADRWIVTAENIDEVRGDMAACDQADELEPGCETWGIIYEPGGQRGQMTIWPDSGRAAVCHGGDSTWGDWDSDDLTLQCDDPRDVFYDADGEEIEETE